MLLNKIFGFMSMLGSWKDSFIIPSDQGGDGKTVYAGFEWVVQLFDYLGPILYALMALTAAAGMIYAIVLGINLAKAEDQSKRDEAKKRLVYTLVAVAVVIVLVIFFNELLPMIVKAVAQPGALNVGKV